MTCATRDGCRRKACLFQLHEVDEHSRWFVTAPKPRLVVMRGSTLLQGYLCPCTNCPLQALTDVEILHMLQVAPIICQLPSNVAALHIEYNHTAVV